MKLKKGFIISKVNDEYIAVAADEAGKAFSGMLKMNGTAAFIAEQLKSEITTDKLVFNVCEKYDVTEELAEESVKSTVENLRKTGILIE